MDEFMKNSNAAAGVQQQCRQSRKVLSPKVMGLAVILSLLVSGGVMAQPPYDANLVKGGNKWFIDAYDDTDPDHLPMATPGICFEYAGVKGTHQQYTWYSDTFPGWHGTASQEADQVFLHGVYADGVGHDAIQVRIIIDAPRHGAIGHWQEWREDGGYGKTVGFANARMIRDGNCTLTAEEAAGPGGLPFFPTPVTRDNPMTFK